VSEGIQVVVPSPIGHQLRELAVAADTPHSTLAAQFVQNGVADGVTDGKIRPLKYPPVTIPVRGGGCAYWA
jgi:hypothetical protein